MFINELLVFGDETGIPLVLNALEDIAVIKGLVISEKRSSLNSMQVFLHEHSSQYPLTVHDQGESGYRKLLSHIHELRPTLGICCSYDQILSDDVLALFPFGIYNVHAALLPQYRGANVLNWVLVNGENETGVTMHKMVGRVDAGPILAQHKVAIGFDDDALSLQKRLNLQVVKVLQEGWEALSKGEANLIEQNEKLANYYRRRTPKDGNFEWNEPAIRIYNLIRALVSPWPGAWFMENGKKEIIDHFLSFECVKQMQKERIGYVIE